MRTGMRSVSLIDISLRNLFAFFSLAHRLQKSPSIRIWSENLSGK